MELKIKTPFTVDASTRTPQFMLDYPNKITGFSACDIDDDSVYIIETDQATADAITARPEYTVLY